MESLTESKHNVCMQVVGKAYPQYLSNRLKYEIETVVRDIELIKRQYLHANTTNFTSAPAATIISTTTTNIATKAMGIKVKLSGNIGTLLD